MIRKSNGIEYSSEKQWPRGGITVIGRDAIGNVVYKRTFYGYSVRESMARAIAEGTN